MTTPPLPTAPPLSDNQDAGRLAAMVRRKCSVTIGGVVRFDWKLLGLESLLCYNAVPSHVSFLNGPIDAPYTPKQRKKAERHKTTTTTNTIVLSKKQKKALADAERKELNLKRITEANIGLNSYDSQRILTTRPDIKPFIIPELHSNSPADGTIWRTNSISKF